MDGFAFGKERIEDDFRIYKRIEFIRIKLYKAL